MTVESPHQVRPVLCRAEGWPVLVWRPERPCLAISSASHGGGIGERRWVFNATVHRDYDRDDPDAHAAELAASLGLAGPGTGLLTAVDVGAASTVTDGGVTATVTTGVSHPTWAAHAPEPPDVAHAIGTINVVATLPERLSDGALVNAVATVAEAKAQALAEVGVAGTGTVTDATVLLCPSDGVARSYGGPRSDAGAPLARSVHAAVRAGLSAGGGPFTREHSECRIV